MEYHVKLGVEVVSAHGVPSGVGVEVVSTRGVP